MAALGLTTCIIPRAQSGDEMIGYPPRLTDFDIAQPTPP